MSNSIIDKFVKVEKLIDLGETKEALEIIAKLNQKAWALFNQFENEKALEIGLKSKELIRKIGNKIWKAHNFFLLGHLYRRIEDFKTGLEYARKGLEIFKEINAQQFVAESLSSIGLVYWWSNDYKQAINYFNQSLAVKEIDPTAIVNNYNALAAIYVVQGELTKAFKFSEEGYKLANEVNYYARLPQFLYYLGFVHFIKREDDKAITKLKQCIKIAEKFTRDQDKLLPLILLLLLYVVNEFSEQAKECLEHLKKLTENNKEKTFTHFYSIARGIILIISGRTRDRAEAERLLKNVIDDVIDNINMTNISQCWFAIGLLCDLLIEELGMSNNLDIINEINPYISMLNDLGEKLNSHLFITEAKLFQAKLELIMMNFNETRMLLTQAQSLADKHNFQWFAQLISNDHDRLLEHQDILEHLERTDAPISERIKLASFDGVIPRLQRKASTKKPKNVNESPVLLLIIAKGGTLIFSKDFTEELTVESDLISNFLSAFESFGDELFSERLDRIKYGENTILMKSLEDFSICYLFKGQSYLAQKKLTRFSEKIKGETLIWQTLQKGYKTNQILETRDVPLIEPIISEIFSTNYPDLNAEIV